MLECVNEFGKESVRGPKRCLRERSRYVREQNRCVKERIRYAFLLGGKGM